MSSNDRRDFLKSAAFATGAFGAAMASSSAGNARAAEPANPANPAAPANKKMTTRQLGRIGAEVSILGAGLGSVFTRGNGDPEAAHERLENALKAGVTYYDTARVYGPSEKLAGPFVKKHRDEIFLVSKSTQRDYDGFMRDFERSLTLLQTDRIDLYHMHSISRRDDIKAMDAGCAKACRELKEQGVIRAYGVTGHSGAASLEEAIKHLDPDALLTVLPASRPDRGRYEDVLLPLCQKRNMGVIAMKCVRHARDADLKGSDLIRYSLSLPGVHTAIVGLDTDAHLQENAAMASGFKPMDAQARRETSEFVQIALAGHPAPWERPSYNDRVAEA